MTRPPSLCVVLACAAVLIFGSDAPAQLRTTVGDALRRATVIEYPPVPLALPVERTVAESLLAYCAPGVRLETRYLSPPVLPGGFRLKVFRGESDTSAGWFSLSLAPDGTGQLTASHPHVLYAAMCTMLEDWMGDDVQKYAEARKEYFRLPWLEGNDGLFVGVPRYIRNYDPGATIREMARLGCSHVPVNVLAATAAAEQGVPGEDYPRFYVYSPDIDQFVETDLTRGLYPPEYLEANLDLLKRNASLAEAYGLTPGLTVCSPRTMPDAFFTKYPYLRGARVDHPFRSYKPRYTATLSHPLVRWHYAQLMKNLMHEVPDLGYLTLWTNDSGSGFEYVSTLYAGRNGGAYLIREWNSDSAIARAAGENVLRYLRLLRDAASGTNSAFRVITSLAYFGSEKDVIADGLGNRLDLQVGPADTLDAARWTALHARGADAPVLFTSVRAAPNYVLGVPCPWLTFDRLSGVIPGVRNVSVTFDPPSLAPWSVNREVIRAFQTRPGIPVDTIVESVARRWFGDTLAPAVVHAWRFVDRAVRSFPDVPLYGNDWAFPWYRQWVRPFVPDIGAVPEGERAYYERHMIASFNNPTLVDFGADAMWLLMDREKAASIVAVCDSLVWRPLDGAIRIFDTLAALSVRKGDGRTAVLGDQRDRLVALRCYFRTLRNVAGWTAGVHGYIGARSAGERERLLQAVRETIDDELKNTEDLYRLWSTTHTDFMPVASHGESWALYGGNFGELLQKKIALMTLYRNGTPRIDPDFMWRVGPGLPQGARGYLQY